MQLEIIVNNFVTLSVKLCYHEVHVLTSCVYRCVIFHKLNTDCQWSFLVFPVAIFLLQEMGYHLHNIFLSLLHRQAEAFLFHLVVHLAWRLNHVLSVET